MKNNALKYHFLFFAALLCSVWFLITGGIWAYFIALLFSYPAGILSFILCWLGKKHDPQKKRYTYVLWILGAGLLWSLSVLMWFLIND
ncbi:MAG: hypothetical protein Fur0041_22140 [Bacteroidia bacterium]